MKVNGPSTINLPERPLGVTQKDDFYLIIRSTVFRHSLSPIEKCKKNIQISPRAFMTDEEYMISQILLSEAESAQNDEKSNAPQVSLKSSSARNKKKKMRNSKKDVPK